MPEAWEELNKMLAFKIALLVSGNAEFAQINLATAWLQDKGITDALKMLQDYKEAEDDDAL